MKTLYDMIYDNALQGKSRYRNVFRDAMACSARVSKSKKEKRKKGQEKMI